MESLLIFVLIIGGAVSTVMIAAPNFCQRVILWWYDHVLMLKPKDDWYYRRWSLNYIRVYGVVLFVLFLLMACMVCLSCPES